MKSTFKAFAKVWLIIGSLLVAADAAGFALCKVLEKIGKPWKTLSTMYNEIFNYKSAKIVAVKWIVMFFAWPITFACSLIGKHEYDRQMGDGS